ncbi:MAG: hypothetical protein RBG13Loki_4298 [Promethearchaeota archaeon CR_4]|nr:MAG: hypothetical protein RBG13Loki_4298 [Candidatus Lokiarchaeota archaeon CR_4]
MEVQFGDFFFVRKVLDIFEELPIFQEIYKGMPPRAFVVFVEYRFYSFFGDLLGKIRDKVYYLSFNNKRAALKSESDQLTQFSKRFPIRLSPNKND